MAFTFGDINVNGWYFGDQAIEALYYGDTEVWSSAPTRDYSKEYLTFEIQSTGNIRWVGTDANFFKTIEYSKDSGETWSSVTATMGSQAAPFTGGTMIPVSQGDVVWFRGNNVSYGYSGSYNSFEGTDVDFIAYGNLTSMLYGSNFTGQTTFISGESYNFRNFFSSCTGLTSIANVVFPTDTPTGCYAWFAQHCQSLTGVPAKLPSTNVRQRSYLAMFRNTPITDSPILPNASVQIESYRGMFDSCSALTGITCYCSRPTESAFTGWVNGVATSGTFTQLIGANWSTGVSGIPENWIVVEV